MTQVPGLEKSKDLIEQLRKDLAALSSKATGLSNLICTSAIRQQRGLGSISQRAFGMSAEDISGQIDMVASIIADVAGRADIEAVGMECGAKNAGMALEDLATSMVDALQFINDHLATVEMRAKTAEMSAQMRAQQFNRLRVHSTTDSAIRDQVWQITNGKCIYCDHALARAPEDLGEHYREFHVDHIVAKANGGPDHLSNYVPACDACNMAKSAKPFAEFFVSKRTKITVIEGGQSKEDAA